MDNKFFCRYGNQCLLYYRGQCRFYHPPPRQHRSVFNLWGNGPRPSSLAQDRPRSYQRFPRPPVGSRFPRPPTSQGAIRAPPLAAPHRRRRVAVTIRDENSNLRLDDDPRSRCPNHERSRIYQQFIRPPAGNMTRLPAPGTRQQRRGFNLRGDDLRTRPPVRGRRLHVLKLPRPPVGSRITRPRSSQPCPPPSIIERLRNVRITRSSPAAAAPPVQARPLGANRTTSTGTSAGGRRASSPAVSEGAHTSPARSDGTTSEDSSSSSSSSTASDFCPRISSAVGPGLPDCYVPTAMPPPNYQWNRNRQSRPPPSPLTMSTPSPRNLRPTTRTSPTATPRLPRGHPLQYLESRNLGRAASSNSPPYPTPSGQSTSVCPSSRTIVHSERNRSGAPLINSTRAPLRETYEPYYSSNCRYGPSCPLKSYGACCFSHPPSCENGRDCIYFRKGTCKFWHSPEAAED
jgi:hypothetical protein